MNEENQKPEWFALADADKAHSPSQLKKSAKVTLLAFPLAAVLTGVAYANLHQESADNGDAPVISQSSATPAVAINSPTPTNHSRTVSDSTKAAPANPITKAPKGHDGEGRENHEDGEGDD